MQEVKIIEDFMPLEYQKITANLLSSVKPQSVEDYAKTLGIESDYKKSSLSNDEFKLLLEHFKRNTSLLIAKTWVDKCDEIRKEKLNARIKRFILKVEGESYCEALKDFGQMLEELAYLFFGEQSKKPDFIEYAFRIDMQLGLFYWYVKHLPEVTDKASPETLRAFLLLGICYLKSI